MDDDDSEHDQLIFPGLRDGPNGRHFKKINTSTEEVDEIPSDGFITTERHEEIFQFAMHGNGHCLVSAFAGSGKTSTMLQLCLHLKRHDPKKRILISAFNKAIIDEISAKVKKAALKVKCLTTHAIGRQSIAPVLLKMGAGVVSVSKPGHPYTGIIRRKYEKEPERRDLALEILGYLFNGCAWLSIGDLMDTDRDDVKHILNHHGIRVPMTSEIPNQDASEKDLVEYLLNLISARVQLLSDGKHIDPKQPHITFNEMISLPLVFDTKMDKYDVVIIDEAQDLNKTKQRLIEKFADDGARVIAVGDPHQAIYGFTGADHRSMDTMKNILEIEKEFFLPVSYRLPKKVCWLAQRDVPGIECLPSAEEGEVILNYDEESDTVHGISVLESGQGRYLDRALRGFDGEALILCRYNAPLFKVASLFIRKDIGFTFRGKSGFAIKYKNFMERIYEKDQPVCTEYIHGENGLLHLMREEESSEIAKNEKKKLKDKDYNSGEANLRIKDMVATCEAIISNALEDGHEKVTDVIGQYRKTKRTGGTIDKFMGIKTQDPDRPGVSSIELSSIHQAKGTEANNVIIWGWNMMPSVHAESEWELIQERNLRYVAVTRAKKKLLLVDVERDGSR